jgi:hypothetical protein
MAWHKSLRDYLTDKKRKGKKNWVDEQAGHRLLADAAVKVVEGVKEAVVERRKMLLQTTERLLVLADDVKEREAQARRAAELKEEEKVREAEDALKGRQELLCDPLIKHLEETYGEKKVEEAKGPAGKNKKGSSSKKKNNKKSSKKNASKKKITHSIDTMQTFSLLEMTAPQTKGEVEGAIKAIKAKKEYCMAAPRPGNREKGKGSKEPSALVQCLDAMRTELQRLKDEHGQVVANQLSPWERYCLK